jgi:hypothetical protein
MPQFSIKGMLIVFAVVALWLSAATGYAAAGDVRKSITLVMFLASGFAAVCFRGRRQMFWVGFFVVFSLMVCNKISDFLIPNNKPTLGWANSVATQWAPSLSTNADVRSAVHSWIYSTIWMAWVLTLATVVGFISAYIYDQSRKSQDA